MNEVIELKDEEYEVQDMPSKKHSSAQTNITGLLFNDDRFTPFVELSLDVSKIDLSPFGIKAKDELIPDISVYVNEGQTESVTVAEQTVDLIDDDDDILKVTEMPDLVIEVLSPRQAISDLLSKFKAYFALGVKSCWLVMPSVKVIKIYSIKGRKICDIQHDADVVDEVMDIRLPIRNIFSRGAKYGNPTAELGEA